VTREKTHKQKCKSDEVMFPAIGCANRKINDKMNFGRDYTQEIGKHGKGLGQLLPHGLVHPVGRLPMFFADAKLRRQYHA
jgi:hypothetical protein